MIPVRNEATHLAATVRSVLDQEYPGPLEVVLAVAPSDDGTEEIAEKLAAGDDRVRVVSNPAGTTPAGLNAAIAASTGDVVVRVDGHAQLRSGYVARAVELLADTGADNVGGIQRATGTTPFEKAVAAAMTSRFGVGDAKFHYGGEPGPTDTVYLGVFRRAALERVGGFDEDLIRNQDYELNWRIRTSGGVVWFSPELWVSYHPRSSPRALARQYFEYGRWKRYVLRRHPGSLRWRHLVPPAAVLANAGAIILGAVGPRAALTVPAVYGAAVLVASVTAGRALELRSALWLPVVFPIMHHAWGLGFLRGGAGTRDATRRRRSSTHTPR